MIQRRYLDITFKETFSLKSLKTIQSQVPCAPAAAGDVGVNKKVNARFFVMDLTNIKPSIRRVRLLLLLVIFLISALFVMNVFNVNTEEAQEEEKKEFMASFTLKLSFPVITKNYCTF